MQKFVVIPAEETRRRQWLDLLGRDRLPVIRPFPRPGASGPVYDVDVGQLSDLALARLAAYAARANNADYAATFDSLRREGAAVPAVGLTLLNETTGKTAVSTPPLPDQLHLLD